MPKRLEFEPTAEVGFDDEGVCDRNVDDPEYNKQWILPLRNAVITAAAVMRVETGTNCPQGGNAGEGGRTIFRVDDLGSTALAARVELTDGRLIEHDMNSVKSVSIMLGGDSEAMMFLAALEFAAETLRQQLRRHAEEKYDMEDAFGRIAYGQNCGGSDGG